MKSSLLIVLLLCLPGLFIFSQNTTVSDTRKPSVFTDLGYSILGVTSSNLFLNMGARLGDQSYAHMTFEDIGDNLIHPNWFWEDGDRFIVNQFGHPYQGATYFGSARINGFSFYESILFAPFGGLMWEMTCEPTSSINDIITTSIGGMAFGEILHRLFLEADASDSIGAKIGAVFINPIAGLNKMYKRPVRESGGNNIYDLSVRTGVEKSFVFIPGHEEESDSWNNPGGYLNLQAVYGNPFIQESKIPYEHFELFAEVSSNISSYNMALITDGYLFSYNPVRTNTRYTSTGLSMHYDFFNATNDIIDNLGYGNLQYSSNAIGWTIKHLYQPAENFYLDIKAHAALTLWGNSMYNSNFVTDDYWVPLGTNRSSYGMGGNLKLSFTFFHNKAGRLDIAAQGYYMTSLKVTKKSSTGNVFFLHSYASYEFPLGKNIAVGARGNFWGLLGLYDSSEDVNRRLAATSVYLTFLR